MEWNNLIKQLEQIGTEMGTLYKEGLVQGGVSAQGTLYNSVGYSIRFESGGIGLFFEASDYWIWVERGRAAGKMPPINAIQKWIISRGIPDKPGLAFLIARKIGRLGIEPRPILNRLIQNKKQEWIDNINRSIKLDIKEILKNGKQNTKQI